MKKGTMRTTAALIATIMLGTLMVGCNRNGTDDENGGQTGTSEYVYVSEYLEIPENISDIRNLVLVGDSLVFVSQNYDYETFESKTLLYSLKLDGSDMSLLENYAPSSIPEDAPENTQGNSSIMGVFSDAQGSLWVAERCSFYYFDLPEDYNEEEDMYGMYAYYRELSESTVIRKLDNTGQELLKIDLSGIVDNVYVNTVSIDDDGNIYVGYEMTIAVLDNSGTLMFTLEVPNWASQLIRMPDGTVAHFGYVDDGQMLKRIDSTTKDWGEEIMMPINAYNLYPGGGEYGLLYSDGSNLFGIDTDTGESSILLNFINSDIGSTSTGDVTMLSDESVVLTAYTIDYNNMSAGMRAIKFDIIILKKVPADSIPPKTVLTLACFSVDMNLRSSIVNFNRTNQKYRIQVNDYSLYRTDDDYYAGLTKLSTEIISGSIPDILLTSSLPFSQYVAKGYIEDLYPYLDADPEFNRSTLVESALKASEIDGKLYQIFPNFAIYSMWGNPSVLGYETGWNMDEFLEVIQANPEATSPMGSLLSKDNFLMLMVLLGGEQFINWSAGTTNFDSDEFVRILEFTNTFPSEVEFNFETYVSEEQLIASGQQIIRMSTVRDFMAMLAERVRFGGEIVYKGLPSQSRAGNAIVISGSMAMTSVCKDKEGAWEFMREILADDGPQTQRSSIWSMFGFPMNRAAFERMLMDAMTQEYITDEDGNEIPLPKLGIMPGRGGYSIITRESFSGDYLAGRVSIAASSTSAPVGNPSGRVYYDPSGPDDMVYIFAMTQEDADQIIALLDTVSGIVGGYDQSLMDLITESAESYFNGRATAQDAARVIQNRTSLYIAELS